MRVRDRSGIALFCLAILALCGLDPAAVAPTPARDASIYGHVRRIGWVVRDLDAVTAHWRRIGITSIEAPRTVHLPDVVYRGQPTTVRVRSASAAVGDMRVEWIQPLGGGPNAYTEYLAARGDGVHHVAFAVPSRERLDDEVASFAKAGVGVVQRGPHAASGSGSSVHLDTAAQGGGMTLALFVDPDDARAASPASQNRDPFNTVTQYAFLVRNVKGVGAYYERLGFGPMPVDHNVSIDRVYRGAPGRFEMYLGWGRGGAVTFEWIEPIVGPSVYDEFLAEKGEGFHHLGFNVPDMDAAIQQLQAAGLQVTMSGGWDANGHAGRFAYFDTERVGGVSLELLWNRPRP